MAKKIDNELILNYKKWRCGGDEDGKYALGRGCTSLLNKEGFMCCLGQFSPQLNPEIKKDEMLEISVPEDLKNNVPYLKKKKFGRSINTRLNSKAIDINDNEDTTPFEKIKSLKELFGKHGFRITVTNMPKKNKFGKSKK